METYRVRRKRERDYITKALMEGGAVVLDEPTGTVAPLVYRIRTPMGEELVLCCYAFSANKYGQAERPADEHRFQIKYGSDFDRYHDLHMPTNDQEVTLLFGIHFEEDIVVASDPAMNNPTWFSKSIEFKNHHIDMVREEGWHGWERAREPRGRRKEHPELSCQSEILLGLKPELFLDYIQLERITTAAPPGERLRVINEWRMSPVLATAAGSDAAGILAIQHVLEDEFGLSALEILDLIVGARRLKTAVRGNVAEKHLDNQLRQILNDVEWLDEDGRPDFRVRFDSSEVRIECKNVSGQTLVDGTIKLDFQRTRAPKNDPCKRYYAETEFEVLAACLHSVTGLWEFRFAATSRLSGRKGCPGRIDPNVRVTEENFTPDLVELLNSM